MEIMKFNDNQKLRMDLNGITSYVAKDEMPVKGNLMRYVIEIVRNYTNVYYVDYGTNKEVRDKDLKALDTKLILLF